jgi:D-alanyl-D-alanine carboxypeptidase/D-alanyl-D-alanine-endopeptidase (penicillin-binding protein 4)
VAATCALVLAGGGLAATQLDSADVLPAPAPSPSPSRLPVLAAPADAAPLPTAAGLQRALAPGLVDPALGGHVALSILDAVTGDPLLESDSREVVTPASTAKIATAVAALTVLPAERRLTTRVVAGTVPGEVVVVGGGDASLAGGLSKTAYPATARLADLAAQVRRAGPVTRVVVDDTLYGGPLLGPGWRLTYVTGGDVAPVTAFMVDGGRTRRSPSRAPRQSDPALAAGRQLAALLGASKVPVVRGRATEGAKELGSVVSPTVQQLVEGMLTRSDNDLAESLARQVAIAQGEPATFAGVAAAMRSVLGDVLTKVGAAPGAVLLQDGSGLSRLNRVQPGALTRLIASVAGQERSRLFPVLSGLPVAGFDGTLEKRYRKGPGLPAAGVVRAKTGTLNGVSALAGLVRTRDGRLLAFDLTADNVPLARTLASQQALDRLAAALAGCGCP